MPFFNAKKYCNEPNLVNQLYTDCTYMNILEDKTVAKQRCRYWSKRISLWTFKLSLLVFCIIFIIGPVIFKYSYGIQRRLVFLNFVNYPVNPDYHSPGLYGCNNTLNYYLTTGQNVTLGVWHVLPLHYDAEQQQRDDVQFTRDYFEGSLRDGRDVVLYNHGNSGSRVSAHRVELYQVLRRHYHVIAFDYRSYGDSSDIEPTERGLVNDTLYIYNWLAERTNARIFVWGHSLGTGVSTHMLGLLYKMENSTRKPSGLILESPFSNFVDEIAEHPLAKIFRPLPWFHYTIIDPMQQNNLVFASDRHILKVDCPILILHAEDDAVVPFKLGDKLYKIAADFRRNDQGFVKFQPFKSELGYGHKYICRAPDIESIFMNFASDAIKDSQEKHLL